MTLSFVYPIARVISSTRTSFALKCSTSYGYNFTASNVFRFVSAKVGSSSLTTTKNMSGIDNIKEVTHAKYDDKQMPFYALGVSLAMQVSGQMDVKTMLENEELDIVLEAFCARFKAGGTADGTTTYDQDPTVILSKYGPQLNKILQEKTAKIVEKLKKDGEDQIRQFVVRNEKNGAIQTDSGLVYYETVKGTGKNPNRTSTVEVHYHGTLTDGKVFDSSVGKGKTVLFPLQTVVRGWQQGLQMMKEGGKATFLIPPHLAYGDGGTKLIPPGATLKFEVELFKIS